MPVDEKIPERKGVRRIMKVALFGTGKYTDAIEGLLQDGTEVAFYLDNDEQKEGKLKSGKRICSLKTIPDRQLDYIIISILDYQAIERQLLEYGYEKKRIIPFFKQYMDFADYGGLFRLPEASCFSLECRMTHHMEQAEKRQRLYHANLIYELSDYVRKKKVMLPKICTVEETCEKIIKDRASVSRYGDGEFQIILGAAKDVYQDDDAELGARLKEILRSNEKGHIVALADDYGCMEGLREENKDTIRKYMTEEKRMQHYGCIDMEKQYYNAYISRPYVIYPHEERERAKGRFDSIKRIWDKEKLLLVEGELTRMGVGNDLFDNAESVERIIAPNKNAFSAYREILSAVLRVSNDRLVLIALGPTATVLAYDLAKHGYWAIDIGHLDLEYEWFLKGEGYSFIPNKYNNEVLGNTLVEDISDKKYDDSIIDRIALK